MIKIGELIESQLAIAFGRTKQVLFSASLRRQISQLLHASAASCRRIAIPQPTSASKLLDASMEHPVPEAVFEALMKISYLPKLFFDPAGFNFLLECAEHRDRVIGVLQRL